MKVLVTGSKGTLGAPLVGELKRRGSEVWGLDIQHHPDANYVRADISHYRQLERIFEIGFDYVYHLAAEFGRLNSDDYYESVWTTNVIGTRNILELQKKLGFKMIFASSSEIYGENNGDILHEGLSLQKPPVFQNEYAMTKWINEAQIIEMERRYNTKTVRCRFFNAYGPGEYYHRYRSVVCLFCYSALKDIPYQVYEGYSRPFMYIDDFIPTLANVMDNFKPGEVYNIAGTEIRTVEELSDIVLRCAGRDDSIVKYIPEDKHNVISKHPDITKARRDLKHNTTVRLEEGVPATLEWMKSIYK